jgi:chemotaxis protein histidine kinase CheA
MTDAELLEKIKTAVEYEGKQVTAGLLGFETADNDRDENLAALKVLLEEAKKRIDTKSPRLSPLYAAFVKYKNSGSTSNFASWYRWIKGTGGDGVFDPAFVRLVVDYLKTFSTNRSGVALLKGIQKKLQEEQRDEKTELQVLQDDTKKKLQDMQNELLAVIKLRTEEGKAFDLKTYRLQKQQQNVAVSAIKAANAQQLAELATKHETEIKEIKKSVEHLNKLTKLKKVMAARQESIKTLQQAIAKQTELLKAVNRPPEIEYEMTKEQKNFAEKVFGGLRHFRAAVLGWKGVLEHTGSAMLDDMLSDVKRRIDFVSINVHQRIMAFSKVLQRYPRLSRERNVSDLRCYAPNFVWPGTLERCWTGGDVASRLYRLGKGVQKMACCEKHLVEIQGVFKDDVVQVEFDENDTTNAVWVVHVRCG